MLENLSLDQLRMFVAAADAGSFSAAARKLQRAQSAVSQSMAALESVLGVALFDRTERLPQLTEEGRALLATAREVISTANALEAHARDMAGDLEAELSIALDVMFPPHVLTEAVREWADIFPSTRLRVYFEALGAVSQAVLDDRCSIGVVGTLPIVPPGLTKQPLFGLPLVCVVAPSHPLASMTGPIAAKIADRHVQIVLTDRSEVTAGQDFGVLGGQAWRVADLSTKHAFLCAGLGWGRMPYPAVAEDIAGGRLVVIQLEGEPLSYTMPMSAIFRFDAHPGRAGRWMIDRLRSVTFDNYSVATKPSGLQRSTGRGKKLVR